MDYNENNAAPVGEEAAAMPVGGGPGFGGPVPDEKKPPKKIKKWIFYLAGGVALLAVIALVLVLVLGSGGGGSAIGKHNAVYAMINEDGTAFLPLMNGKTVTVKGEVQRAAVTADRKHVIVLDEDKNLYITDVKQNGKTKVSEEAESFSNVRDTGFFFISDGICYRYSFAGGGSVELGKAGDMVVARDSLSALYSTEDGKVFRLPGDEQEPERLGSSSGSIRLCGISNDGSIAVWSAADNNEITIYLNEGEERSTLGKVSGRYSYTGALFSEDQQLLFIYNFYGEQVWLKRPGQEAVRVKLGAEPDGGAVYSKNGYLTLDEGAKLEELYFSTEADEGINVYWISTEGERERILSGVNDYAVADGRIVYLNEDNELYYADVAGEKLSKEKKIAGDVDMFELSLNGQYVYYIKDYEDRDEIGNLYCYKLGAKEPVKVASDVPIDGIIFSTDGAGVVFFKEMEFSSGLRQGTLMAWSYQSGERIKIADEVVSRSVTSGLWTASIDLKSFTYMKNGETDKNGKVTGDWYYYNGKEATRIAADVF